MYFYNDDTILWKYFFHWYAQLSMRNGTKQLQIIDYLFL